MNEDCGSRDSNHNSTEKVTMTDTKLPRPTEYVAKYVAMWKIKLANKKIPIEFVTSDSKLIEQICHFEGKSISFFKTRFRRQHDGYIHPTPIRIHNALRDNTQIWSADERTEYLHNIAVHNNPRGVDTVGDLETSRFRTFLQPFLKILELIDFEETTRGSLVDIIAKFKIDTDISLGIQISTSKQSRTGSFGFGNKTGVKIIEYLNNKLVILFICVVDDRIAGVYMIVPTPDVIAEFAKYTGTMQIAPRLLNKNETSSKLNKYFENFRYIHKDFKKGVKGTSKDLDDFQTDFLDLYNKYPDIVNTPAYFSSLFTGTASGKLTEWAGDVSFDTYVAKALNITQTRIHGKCGDVHLDFGGEFQVDDERKTLGVLHANINYYRLEIRHRGRQGLHPSKVRTTTAVVPSTSSDTSNQSEEFTALIVFPVITASGNVALRSDDPSLRGLYMTCDVANRSEYIEILSDTIGTDAYPESMCEIDDSGPKTKIRIRAVFYYDDLKPGSKRLTELRDLYKLFAERTPSEVAITAYNEAVTDELIDREKAILATTRKSKAIKRVVKEVVSGLVDQVEQLLNQ